MGNFKNIKEKLLKYHERDSCLRMINVTNKTVSHYISETWSLDCLYLGEHGVKSKGNRYILIVSETFSKIGRNIPLGNKISQKKIISKTLFRTQKVPGFD